MHSCEHNLGVAFMRSKILISEVSVLEHQASAGNEFRRTRASFVHRDDRE